jgi:acyl-CoA synthetase (NDP forming)
MRLATSKKEAVAMSREIGYPCVLKVSSPDITHKSDAGGVKVGLKSEDEVAQAYDAIMASCLAKFPDAVIEGVTVQNMAAPGLEVIVGMATDPQFGPVLMFGLGGVWVEVLKDVSFKIAPLTKADAAKAVREIRAARLLDGFRGSAAVDTSALEDILLRVSDFVVATPEVKEMDLNPIFAYPDGAIAVDARVILGE